MTACLNHRQNCHGDQVLLKVRQQNCDSMARNGQCSQYWPLTYCQYAQPTVKMKCYHVTKICTHGRYVSTSSYKFEEKKNPTTVGNLFWGRKETQRRIFRSSSSSWVVCVARVVVQSFFFLPQVQVIWFRLSAEAESRPDTRANYSAENKSRLSFWLLFNI